MVGVELLETAADVAGDDPAVVWIEPVVRVAQRVDIAHGPADLAGGDFEGDNPFGGIQMARRSDVDFGIARPLQNQPFIADFHLQADADPQVRFLGLEHVAGLGGDEMRVLFAGGDRGNIDMVAADGLGDGLQVRGGRYDVELVLGLARPR